MARIITADRTAVGDTITAAFNPHGEPVAAPYPLTVDAIECHPLAEFYALVCGDGSLQLTGNATVTVSN